MKASSRSASLLAFYHIVFDDDLSLCIFLDDFTSQLVAPNQGISFRRNDDNLEFPCNKITLKNICINFRPSIKIFRLPIVDPASRTIIAD